MRGGLLLFALFGFGLNGWLYLRGGLMPGLLRAPCLSWGARPGLAGGDPPYNRQADPIGT